MSDLVADAVSAYVDLATPHGGRDAAIADAVSMVAAAIAADARASTSEVNAFRHTFGDRFGVALPADDVVLRREYLGKRSEVALVPAAVRTAAAADAPGDGEHPAWTLYRAAMDVAHAVTALDAFTTATELAALDRLRRATLEVLDEHHVPRPTPGSAVTQVLDGLRDELGAAAETATATADGPTTPAVPATHRPAEDILADLDQLVGLEDVKGHVAKLADILKIRRLRETHGFANPHRTEHAVFVGNPGTGKTTVARLISELYAAYGVVTKGHLVEVDRGGLVAEFVGQTAIKTKGVIEQAMDGMLLIDEAYSLARGGGNDFGREAIDAIVKAMEDMRDRLVIVAAGYPEPMAQFLSANPGLSSRFPTIIPFPDYADEDLAEILERMAAGSDYLIDDTALARLPEIFAAMQRGPTFGNARTARNIFEAAIGTHAARVVKIAEPTEDDLLVLSWDDLVAAADIDLPDATTVHDNDDNDETEVDA